MQLSFAKLVLVFQTIREHCGAVAYGGPSSWVFTYCKKAYRTLGGKPPRPPSYPPTYVSIYGIPITYDQQLLISKMKIYLLRFSHTST